jgi:hypothetical protein
LYKKEFKDTKGVIRTRKSTKNRQHNGKKIKDKRTNNDLQSTQVICSHLLFRRMMNSNTACSLYHHRMAFWSYSDCYKQPVKINEGKIDMKLSFLKSNRAWWLAHAIQNVTSESVKRGWINSRMSENVFWNEVSITDIIFTELRDMECEWFK